MERIELGNTGLRVSRLAFGTGTRGWSGHSDQTALGLQGLADLLRAAYDLGVTFWDTADEYGSHPHVARAMKGLPRDSLVIATKTTARRAVDATRAVERFLRELDTDIIDIVLLHCMVGGDWPSRYAGAMEALRQAVEKGMVRAVGVSCHSLAALEKAAQNEWVDVVLVRVNYAGINMDASPDRVVPVIAQLHAAGKGVYAMKVLGCGALTEDPRRAIRYVADLGTVHSMTIGMTSRDQIEENVRLIDGIYTAGSRPTGDEPGRSARSAPRSWNGR